jgi:hypothetical protein
VLIVSSFFFLLFVSSLLFSSGNVVPVHLLRDAPLIFLCTCSPYAVREDPPGPLPPTFLLPFQFKKKKTMLQELKCL